MSAALQLEEVGPEDLRQFGVAARCLWYALLFIEGHAATMDDLTWATGLTFRGVQVQVHQLARTKCRLFEIRVGTGRGHKTVVTLTPYAHALKRAIYG